MINLLKYAKCWPTPLLSRIPAKKMSMALKDQQMINIVKRKPRWHDIFLTPKGKAISAALVSLCGFAFTAIELGPQSFLLDLIQPLFQHLTDGQPTMVKPEVQKLFEETLISVLNVEDLGRFKAIISVYYLQPLSFGRGVTNRILVLLPVYYNYLEEEDILDEHLKKLLISHVAGANCELDLDDPNTQVIKESLLLSENAKKFGMAREILRSGENLEMQSTIMAWTSLATAYTMSKFGNYKLKLFSGPRALRLSLYAMAGAVNFVIFRQCYGFIKHRIDLELDDQVSRLSESYAQGGVEFYTKVQQKQLALRALIPNNEGENLFNIYGEEIQPLFSKKATLTERIEKCKSIIDLHHAGLQ